MAFEVAIHILLALVSYSLLSRTSLASYSKSCRSTGGVDTSTLSAEQQAAIEYQNLIPCDADSKKQPFYDALAANLGENVENFASYIPTLKTSFELCRSTTDRSCPGSSRITWCIHLYHPTENVEICLDKNGVINATDHARLLLLECFYSVEETCPDLPEGCLKITDPKHYLDGSIMVCSVQSENCSISSTHLHVKATIHEKKPPAINIYNTTDLVLGQTNLFLCEVIFFESRLPLHAKWEINSTFVQKIHETPFCSLAPDCNEDTQATMLKKDRVRAYEEQRITPGCPFDIFLFREWLWIDNATEADGLLDYSCFGASTFFSPFRRWVFWRSKIRLNPVLPLLDVTILEVPVFGNSVSANNQPYNLTVIQTETFQWPISVKAGLGDELVWLYNGEVIPATNISQVPNCSDNEVDQLFVVHWPAEDLGGYGRGLNATLVACHLTLPMAYGLYECHLNRSRGRAVELWSALLQTMEIATSKGPSISSAIQIGIGLAAGGAFVVMVVFFLVLFMCCLKHKYMTDQISKLNSHIYSTTDVFMDGDVKGKSPESKNSLKRKNPKSLHCNDPFEFPREKLLVTDVLLGEGTFGRVLQAKAQGIVEKAPDKNLVAIKICRENAFHQEVSLWEELQLMKKLEPHANIVNLLGCCSTPNGPLCLIIEYALHGSMKDFLQECLRKQSHSTSSYNTSSSACPDGACEKISLSQQNSVFSTSSEAGQSDSPCSATTEGKCPRRKSSTATSVAKDSGYFGRECAMSATSASSYINTGPLHIEDIQNFAIQIVQGLQHLEHMNVVHCDLAARNILIAEGFVLKIADFGMARDLSGAECYTKHREGKIPVKWTPPEALQDHTFTYKSDVWSFGVTLWEIFSYGAKPYPDQKIQLTFESFIRYLVEGNRLPQPTSCPTHFYHLMQCCWQLAPQQRPASSDLLKLLMIDISHVENETQL